MRLRPPATFVGLLAPAALLFAGFLSGARAQGADAAVRDAFFRAVGDHFTVPVQEVTIISGWGLSSDEVPVVLFLAQKAGVSPDALIGVRRGGRPWLDVAGRFGLDARAFHLPLPADGDLGTLTRAYGEFRRRPAGEWSLVRLEDLEVITLVNLRVLSEQTGATPLMVLRKWEEAGSFVASYPLLIRR